MDNHAAMIKPIESVVFPLIYLYFLTNGDKIKMRFHELLLQNSSLTFCDGTSCFSGSIGKNNS